MAGSLQARLKVWLASEDVTATDLNAEFDNQLTAMQPLLIDDYSADVTQMRVTTDPGEVGTESLATTLAGEIARLRQMLKEVTGEDQWYESPVASLLGLSNAIGTGLTDNRLVSGRVLTTSEQPAFLVPNGAARTVKLDGTPTNFIYYIDGAEYSITSDVTLTSLTAAPASNNTCLINDAVAADQYWTKHTGEDGSEIPVDTMGTEITALVGKLAAFKLDNGSASEYFLAYVDSATRLTRARRGYFFDSTDAAIPRIVYSNNDTITLMKLTWVFAKSNGTLTATYNPPTWSADEPSSPSLGDYWYDLANNTWKVRSVSTFDVANAVLVGVCIQDTTNTVGARSFEFFKNYAELNTMEIIAESNTQVKSRHVGSSVNVWGTVVKSDYGFRTWDITLHRDTGVSESASTYYYFYLTEDGDQVISDVKPYNRSEDLNGYYHPHQSWRCVGFAFNDGSSNLSNVESYYNRYEEKIITPTQTAAMNIEVIPKIIRLDGSGGAYSEHLPPAALWRGQEIVFIRTDNTPANAVTLDGYGAETINGNATFPLYTQYEVVKLLSDGANLIVTGRITDTGVINGGALTITGSTSNPTKGTTTLDAFYWKRVGDECLFRYDYKQSAGGVNGTGDYQIALPTGITIDVNKTTVNTGVFGAANPSGALSIIGSGNMTLASAFQPQYAYVLSTTQFKIWASGGGVWSAGYGGLNVATTGVSINGKFPVTGWLP